ncbi:MAG: sulfatase-like hydrolase/transferase [Candidatus Latescibacteria bacterium]|nr:sulfatase-like hydrolase/transferase [Candidatus Latescibacterota bacterium]
MSRPNILLLMTDQQRWDGLGCSGGWVETPHLDRLAGEGLRFEHCLTNSPVCIPARLSLATGLYPHNTGVWNNQHSQLDPQQPNWMRVLRELGYRTSLFGKTHLHPHQGDLRQREELMHAYGLDYVDEIGGPRASARVLSHMTAEWEAKGVWQAYRADIEERFATVPHVARPSPLELEDYADIYVGRKARQYLEAYQEPAPWCCWVSFGGPHEPWDTPEPYASMYDPQAMPAPRPAPQDTAPRPEGRLDQMRSNGPQLEAGDAGAMRANYAGNITLIDEQIGRIFAAVEARGEWDNTVVVLVSDHGEMNGDADLIYKSNLLDPAVRVPLLVRAPGKAAGLVSHTPVEWFDVGPTLVELAGGQLDYPQFAQSLVPVLDDPDRCHRREAIAEIDGEIALSNENWKAVLNAQGQVYLLFDRRQDPQEQRNLAGRPDIQGLADQLRLRILERVMESQVGVRRG